MVIETFGDMLYYPGSETLKEFPCPEDLKTRIILSTKPPKGYLDSRKIPKFNGGLSLSLSPDLRGKDPAEQDRWGKEVTDLTPLYDSDKVHGHIIFTLSCSLAMKLSHTSIYYF